MINKRRFAINISFSLFQSIFIALFYYFLYKFLLNKLGTEQLGVWSIILAISSTANIANLGIGSSVIRFTAKFNFTDDFRSVNRLIHTSFFLIGGLFLATSLIIYLIAPFWIHAVIDKEFIDLAASIVPYSIACLWLNAVSSSVFLPCLDGLQKNYIRSILTIITTAVMLVICFTLVPRYGLLGVAYAQLSQAILLLLLSVCVLKINYKRLSFFPFYWDKNIFKQIFSFGMREQVISIAQLCFDPLTKSLLGRFGGLSYTSYYEIANRLVVQSRGLLINANMIMMPLFTEAHERNDESLKSIYVKNFYINYLLSFLWFGLVVGLSTIVSKLLFGNINLVFMLCVFILSIAYLLNILASPAYFSNMGSGKLKDNVISNIIICLLNVALGILLGTIWHGNGVVLSWGIALAFGSVYVIYSYQKRNHISLKSFFDFFTILNNLSVIFFVACIYWIFLNYSMSLWIMVAITVLLFGIFCITPVLMNPHIKEIIVPIKKKIFNKQ